LKLSLVKSPDLLLTLQLADAGFDRVFGLPHDVQAFEEFLWTNVGVIW
jgi:hypothetical protein